MGLFCVVKSFGSEKKRLKIVKNESKRGETGNEESRST